MAEQAGTVTIYRETLIGDHLCEALEEMVEAGKLTEAMVRACMGMRSWLCLAPCAVSAA